MTGNTPDVIFFGHGPVADQIRRTLTDLAVLGLTDSFSWIDPYLDPAGPTVRHISAEGSRNTGLDRILRSVHGSPLLIALDIEDDRCDGLDLRQTDRWISRMVSRLSTGSLPHQVRVLVPRLPRNRRPPRPDLSWTVTVAVAPEDSEAPDAPLSPVLRTGDPTATAAATAPVLCGLTGLWAGSDACALFDDTGALMSTGDQFSVRMVRAYHRTVDASEVEDRLRRAATDIRDQLPQPVTREGRQFDHLGENDSTPQQMAYRLLGKYRDSLATPMVPETVPSRSHRSWFRVVTNFLRTYVVHGIGSPGRWFATARNSVRGAMDRNVQKSLYGEDSPVRVISDPTVTGGRGGTLGIISEATTRHRLDRQQRGIRIGEEPQLNDMWTSYRDVALTLVDGARRQEGVLDVPADAYGNRKIVLQGWQSVPDVDGSFHGFDPLLNQQLRMAPEDTDIPPFDPQKAADYETGLSAVAGQTRNRDIRSLRRSFDEWKATVSRSFAWSTAEGLQQMITESRGNVRTQTARLDRNLAALKAAEDWDSEARLRAYRWKTRFIGALWAVLTVIMVLAVVIRLKEDWQTSFFTGLDWPWAAAWEILGTVVLLGFHMSVFAAVRRGLEKHTQDMTLLKQNARTAAGNVDLAVDNCDRQVRAYRQLLSWSTLLGRAISRPLGRDSTTPSVLAVPTAGLPLSTGIGRAAVPEEDFRPLVNAVRTRIFQVNWAGEALDRLLADAAASREHLENDHIQSLSYLTEQAGDGSGTPLDRLARWSVGPEMEDRDHTRRNWSEVIASTDFTRDPARRISTVEFSVDGHPVTVSTDRFLSTLTGENPASGSFLQDALSEVAVTNGACLMDPALCLLDRSGDRGTTPGSGRESLTRSVTLVQFGRVTRLDNLGAGLSSDADRPAPALPDFDLPADVVVSGIPVTTPFDQPAFRPPVSPLDNPDWDSLF